MYSTETGPHHHQGLRIAVGAFHTSPIEILYAIQETVYELCFKNKKNCPSNPAYSCVFEPPNSKLFLKSKLTPPLCFHIPPLFEDSKIDLCVVDDVTVSHTPSWSQSEPQMCLSLTKF